MLQIEVRNVGFIIWHKLTGGLQRQWANKPLKTFTEALEAFRTAMSFRFLSKCWHLYPRSPVGERRMGMPINVAGLHIDSMLGCKC